MSLVEPIAASQVDAKSPVDDVLAHAIKADLEDLDGRITSSKSFDYEFKLNGYLNSFPSSQRKRLDGALIARAQTFTRARLYLEGPGTSGSLIADIRKYQRPNTLITGISRQYSASINSIAQIAPALATQSISKATAQINTQSISRWKAQLSLSSIILLGNNLVRINLASAMDSDWLVGDTVTFSSCTNAGNDGSFAIVRKNDDAGNNIVITNASAVAETASPGKADLDAWKYVYTNPVDTTNFVATESVVFATHTTGANNGTFTIYAVNSGGNNIIIKSASGVAQAGVAGTADSSRWVYTYALAVASDFVVGEKARFATHTTGANNGDFTIRAVNSGGNNLIVSNASGVAQGGVAGTANTTRWVYALTSNPTSSFSVGQNLVAASTTDPLNSGTFAVKEINHSGLNNLVVSNTAGVAQVGAAGTLVHSRMLISMASDLSSIYTTNSRVETTNVASSTNVGAYTVLEVNRGGGSNYNVVVDNPTGVVQASPCGRIMLESKSILTTPLTLTLPTSTLNATNRDMQYVETSSFTSEATVVAGDILAMELTSIPVGPAHTAVLQLV